MNRILKVLFFCLMLLPFTVNAKEELNLYLFYGNGCPHCADEEEFLNNYLENKDTVKLHLFEVWNNDENARKLQDVKEILDVDRSGVPFLVIGNEVIVGFSKDVTEDRIISLINYYSEKNFDDKVGKYLGIVDEEENKDIVIDKHENDNYNVPILGKTNVKQVSLVLVSIIMGLVDGFNPCAMWILIFLISMLIGTKNRKRMWILGITFLVASASVYFLFMIAWLDVAVLFNKIIYIRTVISLFAVVFGGIQIFRYLYSLTSKKDTGCEVVNQTRRKKIMTSIKKIVTEKSYILAILGIILLAISVNIIELLCSLGLPVMFAEILTVNDLNKTMQIIYSLIYVLFFLIDDIIIFIIAMKTFEIKAISNKIGKYSHLIGGIIMVIIGFLLLYKPEWLMFNF